MILKRVLILIGAAIGVTSAYAQPATFVDLGTISDTSALYSVPDRTVGVTLGGNQVKWFRFVLAGPTSPTGAFLDIDLFATGPNPQPDTEIGLYSATGLMIANDDDDGHDL